MEAQKHDPCPKGKPKISPWRRGHASAFPALNRDARHFFGFSESGALGSRVFFFWFFKKMRVFRRFFFRARGARRGPGRRPLHSQVPDLIRHLSHSIANTRRFKKNHLASVRATEAQKHDPCPKGRLLTSLVKRVCSEAMYKSDVFAAPQARALFYNEVFAAAFCNVVKIWCFCS